MAALSKNRRKKGGQPTAQDLVLTLSQSLGLDITQEYDSESFAQLGVDLYQSQDPDAYPAQGEHLYNLLVQLQGILATQQESTAIVPTERKTKVWFTRENRVRSVTDADIVDTFLNNPTIVKVSSLINEDYTELELLVLEDIDV